MEPIKNRGQIISWCLFDFANSSYSAVIASVIFPVYYTTVVVGNETGVGDLWWGRMVSLSMFIVVITSPFLGGIADFSGIRKRLLLFYTFICILSVASLSLVREGMVIEGFLLMLIANTGMEGGLVFYNSFLPEIADKTHIGRVSAWGYGVGYAGSILSLLIAIPLVSKGYYGATWVMVALFFAIFSLPAFIFLPKDRKDGLKITTASSEGLKYICKTFKEIWLNREFRKFLIAYLIYQDGINTVIMFSSIYASTTMGFQSGELIGLYLIIQITALIGAFLLAGPIDWWGPKKVVSLSLAMWITVTTIVYLADSKTAFWFIASAAGIGLGTIQAATRAFFTQFIPSGKESEYFGIYSMAGKSSSIIGPLLFGWISYSYGSQKPAILSVAVFFIFGLVMIRSVKGGGPTISRLSNA
ncbi:MAG: hypothetical protein A2073_00635 [Deltaproteobacteria bacterium GWC2_42_11]|nr:MAG: hypothetical protein A2073_00635 [Deltaproteobacteria bacterium GWC2_42_11]HBO84019.1 MFS transporter [Deltaproteobacteria bacterium]